MGVVDSDGKQQNDSFQTQQPRFDAPRCKALLAEPAPALFFPYVPVEYLYCKSAWAL